jgi:trehalose 2-sulfotransferase
MKLPFEKVTGHEAKLREYFDEFDVPADAVALNKPVCIMLFTNRSGSSLVSEHMRSMHQFTGFGEPLNSRWIIDQCERENLTRFIDYLRWQSSRLYRQKPGALLGMKASYGQAMMLMRSRAIPLFFNDVRWVVIEREDLLSQAVSFSIADQTKQWHSFDRGKAVDPVYNFQDIRRRLRGFALSNIANNMFCTVFDIRPYRIVYEEFARDPVAGARALAGYLGVDDVTIDSEVLQMKRQRTSFSAEFRRRFLADYQAGLGGSGSIAGEDQADTE